MRKFFVLAAIAGLFVCGSAFGADYSTDFEGANPLDGWVTSGNVSVRTDIAIDSQAIFVPGQDILTNVRSFMYYPLGNMDGIVTMWIYDFGVSQQNDVIGQDANGADVTAGQYGPMWGFIGLGGTAAGASLIDKTHTDTDKGYTSLIGNDGVTGSQWSPYWIGAIAPTRTSTVSEPGDIVVDPDTGEDTYPWVHPVAGWTKWTISIFGSDMTIIGENADGTATTGEKSYTLGANFGSDGPDGILIGGGKDKGSGVIVDNVSFEVPEPASLSLLAIGGLLALRRR